MGFRKTEKGNVIYDFDFTPTKLVPTKKGLYTVADDEGHSAPIMFEFQGQRYRDYGFVFCGYESEHGIERCISTNVQLVATLASLFDRCEKDGSDVFDPWSVKDLAMKGTWFTLMDLNDAKSYMKENGYPKDGFRLLMEEM